MALRHNHALSQDVSAASLRLDLPHVRRDLHMSDEMEEIHALETPTSNAPSCFCTCGAQVAGGFNLQVEFWWLWLRVRCVVVELLLYLGHRKVWHENTTNHICEKVAVLDAIPQSHIVAHQTCQYPEATVHHSTHVVPIFGGCCSDDVQQDREVIRETEQHRPYHLCCILPKTMTWPLVAL